MIPTEARKALARIIPVCDALTYDAMGWVVTACLKPLTLKQDGEWERFRVP